jgi:hypothetical protein
MKYLKTETTEYGPFLGKTGTRQTAQNGQMLNFFDQFCLESNFNGGHFYEKIQMFLNWGHRVWAVSTKWVPAKQPKKVRRKKNYFFELKIQIEQGSFLHKKLCQSKVTIVGIGPTAHGPCR